MGFFWPSDESSEYKQLMQDGCLDRLLEKCLPLGQNIRRKLIDLTLKFLYYILKRTIYNLFNLKPLFLGIH
jgi:hypothetical protein